LKMRLNYEKHYKEDKGFNPHYDVPYKTLRYIRKLKMRNTCAELKADAFLNDPDYKDLEIWDLKYISTSDEEDNDSSEEGSSSSSGSSSESETEEAKKGDPKTIWKLEPGKNEGVP